MILRTSKIYGRMFNIANKLLIKVIICVLVIFSANVLMTQAQGPEDEEPLIIAPSGRLDLTLKRLGYDASQLQLNRDIPQQSFRIRLPGNLSILPTGNYLDLITSHFPETPEKPALLEIDVNGRMMSSLPLTASNATSTTVRLNLRDDHLQGGRNSIDIKLNTGATCEEPGGFVNVLVDENTTLSLNYQQHPYSADLALYPFPFVEQSLLNIPTVIVLPDEPSSDELSTAATVAAGLGQLSGGELILTTTVTSDLSTDIRDNSHLIIIGKRDTHSLIDDLTLPLAIDDTTLEPGQGILQEIISPWNQFRTVLIVSSLDDIGLLKAGQALNRQAHFLGMRGPVAIVLDLRPLAESNVSDPVQFTLASLSYEDEIFYGTLPSQATFEFELPMGWQLDQTPFFVLNFGHSDIISEDSTLDVQLNGVPIGSTLLDQSNAASGELILSLPERLLRTGRNRLVLSVDMGLSNVEVCDGVDNRRAWFVINNESEIILAHNVINLSPDLSHFPASFSQASTSDQTAFIVPDQSSVQTYNKLTQLAMLLGNASIAKDLVIEVRYASEIEENILQSHHLVLLGRPTENVLLAEINSQLPHPFILDSDLLEPLVVDTVAFLPDPERDAGLLEILESPWNEQKGLLVVTGVTDEGVSLAVRALVEKSKNLNGNLAVVEMISTSFLDETNGIDVYSTDTRKTPVSLTQKESSKREDSSLSDNILSTLANRWWK